MVRSTQQIGCEQPRTDALEKVTGRATYIGDMVFPNMLVGKILRSPIAHGWIKKIDTSEAEKLPGVIATLTRDDIVNYNDYGIVYADQSIVAKDKVHYIGDLVAAVAAEDEATANRALELINVQYEELPHVLTIDDAIAPGAPLVHEKVRPANNFKDLKYMVTVDGTNICNHFKLRKGDLQEGFKQADYIIEGEFSTKPIQHVPLEPHVAIATVVPYHEIDVWSNNQHPHIIRNQLKQIFNLPLSKIRVRTSYVGGGFGGKLYPKLEPIAIALAWKAGRTVKISLNREEEFKTITRHATKVWLKTGVKKDGTITARETKSYFDTGAYADIGPRVVKNSGFAGTGPYNIPNVKTDAHGIYTNKPPAGAYRGLGVPQMTWAYESHMDEIARKIGMDPLAFRMKNVIRSGDYYATGELMTDIGFDALLESCTEGLGWANQLSSNMVGDKNIARGKGVACSLKATITPSTASARLTMFSDGSVILYVSTVELGQGCQTVFRQIVAQELMVPIENISVVHPDTSVTPYDIGTNSSRSTYHMGNAIILACKDVKEKLLENAGFILQTPFQYLEYKENAIYSSLKKKSITFEEAAKGPHLDSGNIMGYGNYQTVGGLDPETGQGKGSVFWMAAAGATLVDVDLDTGEVTIPHYVGAVDVGKALNPANCKQQNEGSIVMSIGAAFTEEMVYDEKGNLLNASLLDYIIPTVKDLPKSITNINVEIPHRDGPYGAKGIGEILTTPPCAAIGNAIYNATGVRPRELPITAEKLFFLLKEQTIDKEKN